MRLRNLAITFLLVSVLFSSCEKDTDDSGLKLEEMHQIIFLPDGSSLIAGKYGSNIRLIKTSSTFEPVWLKENYPWGINLKEITWGTDGYSARVTNLFNKDNGNFICVVSIEEGGDVVQSKTVILEINSSGEEVRNVQFDGGAFDPYIIVQCSDQGFLMKTYDKFIKLNTMLEIEWEKDSNEGIYDIFAMKFFDGNRLITTGSYDHNRLFFRLLDENMNYMLTLLAGETSGYGEEAGFDLSNLDNNGFLVAGRSRHLSGNFNMDGYLTRISPSGYILWTRRFGDDSEQYFKKVIYSDNDVIVTEGQQGSIGEPDEKRLFLKFNAYGHFLDTSYWDISTSFYRVKADQFVKIVQETSTINISNVSLDEIFP